MNMDECDEKVQLRKLWPMLLEEPMTLADEQIEALLAEKKKLREELSWLASHFPYRVEAVKIFRARKKQLEKLSNEELEALARRFQKSWAAAVTDDWDDSAGDSLYEAPPLDSDENIVSTIIEERNAALNKFA